MSQGDESRIVKDPICGKDVDTLRARAVGIFGGETFYFCSADCKAKFRDPRQGLSAAPPREAGERRRPDAKEEAALDGTGPRYAHSRIRRITGETGSPVVQIDLSPNKKAKVTPAAPSAEAPREASEEEPLEPARSSPRWLLIVVVMLIIAGGVVWFTLKHR